MTSKIDENCQELENVEKIAPSEIGSGKSNLDKPSPSPNHREKLYHSPHGSSKHNSLQLKLSASLQRKLKSKAASEGVSIEEFVVELISEGLVLRAWEIMERKSTMRQPNNGQSGRQGKGYRPGNFNGRRQNQGGGANYPNSQGRRPNNYNSILEDGPNFIEYVRNQEKRQR